MGVCKKIVFPYDKVMPNSRVVLYGAGNIGGGGIPRTPNKSLL